MRSDSQGQVRSGRSGLARHVPLSRRNSRQAWRGPLWIRFAWHGRHRFARFGRHPMAGNSWHGVAIRRTAGDARFPSNGKGTAGMALHGCDRHRRSGMVSHAEDRQEARGIEDQFGVSPDTTRQACQRSAVIVHQWPITAGTGRKARPGLQPHGRHGRQVVAIPSRSGLASQVNAGTVGRPGHEP